MRIKVYQLFMIGVEYEVEAESCEEAIDVAAEEGFTPEKLDSIVSEAIIQIQANELREEENPEC